MPFIGKNPTSGFSTIVKDDLTPDGSTTAFTLSKQVASANDIAVFVGNVRQEPTDAYSVSGTTLTMTAAPASGVNFYVLHIAGTLESSVVPADNTISTAKIQSSAVTDAKMASTLDLSGKTVTYGLTSGDMPAGSVLQFKYDQYSGTSSQALSFNTDTQLNNLSVTITPTSTSSILVLETHIFHETSTSDHNLVWFFFQDSTALKAPVDGARRSGISAGSTAYWDSDLNSTASSAFYKHIITPTTTSALTFKVGVNVGDPSGGTIYFNRTGQDLSSTGYERGLSYLSVKEIKG